MELGNYSSAFICIDLVPLKKTVDTFLCAFAHCFQGAERKPLENQWKTNVLNNLESNISLHVP